MNDPATILRTLQAIEQDLANRQNDFSEAAGKRARLVREVEYEQAVAFAKAPGNTTEKRERAKVAVGASQAYKDLTAAESTYDACKAAVGVLETRASIGQTLLRTLREAG
jgi:hypothetical protein